MKSALGKICYKLSGLCWRIRLKSACYLLAGWGFKLSYKPKTYR